MNNNFIKQSNNYLNCPATMGGNFSCFPDQAGLFLPRKEITLIKLEA
jgi:hypothetical protein